MKLESMNAVEIQMIRYLMTSGAISQISGVTMIGGEEVDWDLQRLTNSTSDGRVRYCASFGSNFESFDDVDAAMAYLTEVACQEAA